MQASDTDFMQQAIALGRRGLGRTAPNPSVGCVLVDADQHVIGTGWTQPGGRPHAETQALAQAGEQAHGATAYVTLEPCAHHGQTAPCAQALVDAGISKVIFANVDPDPRVAGQGAAMLQAANVQVESGLCADQASCLHQGFFTRIGASRPMVTLKIAASANGFMRTPEGEAPWITGPLARHYGHLLRAQHDAIITGAGTLMADNPTLDCRLPGMADRSPVPVVMSHHDRVPQACKLAARDDAARVLFYTQAATQTHNFTYIQRSELKPADVLQDLANRGINSALLECGPTLAQQFLASHLVDAIAYFQAPHEVAISGESDISLMGLDLSGAFVAHHHLTLGDDIYQSWQRQPQQEATSCSRA